LLEARWLRDARGLQHALGAAQRAPQRQGTRMACERLAQVMKRLLGLSIAQLTPRGLDALGCLGTGRFRLGGPQLFEYRAQLARHLGGTRQALRRVLDERARHEIAQLRERLARLVRERLGLAVDD